ncbi:MAG: photosynthetic reaction center cytochrome c subunit [Sphingomonas sp.]|uniref:photosynthetic reaction center cytochrome PufC n=1 Tax=Sphingomonas sp. TaxID=28214 RepID=UPI0025CF3C5B|nr:photosynthetic reaction center cytochrome PufC [Sphingomonas sp.]MBX9882041.1 photosynthetic reaction center cytochrome c subunit [Sphingomonas sp.]
MSVARYLVPLTVGALSLALSGCEFGPKLVSQNGYRGTGLDQVTTVKRRAPQPVPPPPYELPPADGQRASEVYQNVKVLGNISAERFNYLMLAINTWVAPQEGADPNNVGCNYCHNPNNLASDEKYTKIVARRMIQMTQAINSKWSAHVKQTGVTCYTCHRGNAVPRYVWSMADAAGAQPASTRLMGYKHGQDTPAATPAYASLPYDPFTPYLRGASNIRVQGRQPLPSDTSHASIARTELTYGLMMHMSSALGVNCTFCHNSRAWSDWSQSSPQRVTAWYGIRMARDVNNEYISSLTSVFPDYRKGPHGDVYKANCQTCHQGLNKPLGGVSMLKNYPDLGPPAAAPVVAQTTPEAPPLKTVGEAAQGQPAGTAATHATR